ncbi:MAG: MiaB/RimO family radical SAM methylthiotransferase [Oscillospiraceae bacterium]|nr:MiaB/RimO family radical SAM methylthiotransferase [Oscillospiraceae bacterium]
MNIHFITFGCKVNMYETECIRHLFEKAGFTSTDDPTDADIFVINSCTVTHESDVKLLKALRRIRREHPDAVIVLMGCYPQVHDIPSYIGADIVTGTKDRAKIVDMVKVFMRERSPIVSLPSVDDAQYEILTAPTIHGHTRGFIKIQDGCSMRCTYCIIPYARGKVRSKPIDIIRREAEALAANGYKEIVLIGIDIMCYRWEGKRLIDAAEACCVDGIERIRLGSLEPGLVKYDDLLRLRDTGKFCPSFHLSLHSGCDKTLREMGRRYTSEEYARITDLCREVFPGCGISADIMVGFPGETYEDHRISCEFAEKIGFADMHVFMYSPRDGTPAAERTDQIDPAIKKLRAAEMSAIGSISRQKFLTGLIGSELSVLTERPGRDGLAHGHAPNNAHIKILTENILPNSILCVTIDSVGDDHCLGHLT